MMIMKAVDDIHSRGGVVEELVSLCGGLPDPVAADNPLRYKFSWSPKGCSHCDNKCLVIKLCRLYSCCRCDDGSV